MIDDIIESFEEENTIWNKIFKKDKRLNEYNQKLENLSLNFLTHIIVKI